MATNAQIFNALLASQRASGVTLSGGKVYFYEPGTTNLKTIWLNRNKSTPAGNPYTLDSNGQAQIYGDGLYDIQVKNATESVSLPLWEDVQIKDFTGEVTYSVSDYASLEAAVTAIGATKATLVFGTDQSLANSLTIPSTMELKSVNEAKITIADTKTLTINGHIDAGLWQIFAGTGVVAGLEVSYPEWFGSARNGTADDTTPIQNAINSLSDTIGGVLLLDVGTYKTTSGLVIRNDRIWIRGKGGRVSIIQFQPTAAGTAITFEKIVNVAEYIIFQGGIEGVGFYSSDSTYKKIALDLVNTSQFNISDIYVAGTVLVGDTYFWSGDNSIGIQYRGREMCTTKKTQITADSPIVIANNPNGGTSNLDNDHHHFEDCYLLANGQPVVTVNSGVKITNMSWNGYQSWTLGTYGLYWSDTTSTDVSYNISFSNLRPEQGDASSYNIYIAHNTGLQNLSFNNCNFDLIRKGIYLRKILYPVMQSCQYAGTDDALNIDGSVVQMSIKGCYWQNAATATITDQKVLFASPLYGGAEPLSGDMILTSTSPALAYSRNIDMDGSISSPSFTLANTAVTALGSATLIPVGYLVIIDSENLVGTFLINGSQHSTALVSSTGGLYYSATKDTASTTNVYWLTDHYEIQNNRGASRNYRIMLIGSYNSSI